MPRIDNLSSVENDLDGQIATIRKQIKNLANNKVTSPAQLTVGAGGLEVIGPTQLDDGLAVTGAVSAPGGVTGPVTGNVHGNVTGSISGGTVSGSTVTSTGDVDAGGNLNGVNIYGTSIFAANAGNINGNITTSRTTVWARDSDGYLGNTLSSIRFKTDVVDTDIDPLAVLSIAVKHYSYIAEVRKRDDPTYEGYIGPKYHVALEVGMIAEDLHAAGLWQFVTYEHETVVQDDVQVEQLRLDVNGQPIPESIHYILWGMAVQVATQHVWTEHLKLVQAQIADRADIDRILTHLGI